MTTLDPEQLREAGFGQEWRVRWKYKNKVYFPGAKDSTDWSTNRPGCVQWMGVLSANPEIQDVWIEMHWVSTSVTEEGVLS